MKPTLHPVHLLGASVLLAAALVGACGGNGGAPPTAEELAVRLVSADTFEGDWSVNPGPDDGGDMSSGVIPEDQRAMLPQLELCDAASNEARAAAESVRWLAFRQLDLAEPDPIEPPGDRTGHLVFVQEFLTAGDREELAATFELLRSGSEACLGDIEASDEGPGRAEAMSVPEVGDARFGVLTTMDEAAGWAEWRLHTAYVLDGDVVLSVVVVDIRAGDGVEPYYSVDDVGEMIAQAADAL